MFYYNLLILKINTTGHGVCPVADGLSLWNSKVWAVFKLPLDTGHLAA